MKPSHALTIPSSCTLVRGISASMSIAFAIDAGMASYVGAAGAGAAEGAGRDAARAAAIDVAAIAVEVQRCQTTSSWNMLACAQLLVDEAKNTEAVAKQEQAIISGKRPYALTRLKWLTLCIYHPIENPNFPDKMSVWISLLTSVAV